MIFIKAAELVEFAIDTILDLVHTIFIKAKNWYQYTLFTTIKQRQKKREGHCLRFCCNFDPSNCGPCHGRHVYNRRKVKYEKDILYFCIDCPYREK